MAEEQKLSVSVLSSFKATSLVSIALIAFGFGFTANTNAVSSANMSGPSCELNLGIVTDSVEFEYLPFVEFKYLPEHAAMKLGYRYVAAFVRNLQLPLREDPRVIHKVKIEFLEINKFKESGLDINKYPLLPVKTLRAVNGEPGLFELSYRITNQLGQSTKIQFLIKLDGADRPVRLFGVGGREYSFNNYIFVPKYN